MDEASTWHGGRPQPRRVCVRWGSSALPQKGHSPLLSPILRVEAENFEIGPEVGALPVIANFVALEQQIILVKPEVNRYRNGVGYNRLHFGALALRHLVRKLTSAQATLYYNIFIRRVPSAPRKGHSTPSFRPMSIVATVAHLSYC